MSSHRSKLTTARTVLSAALNWVTIPVLSSAGKILTTSEAFFHFGPAIPVSITGIDLDHVGDDPSVVRFAKKAKAAKLRSRIVYSGETYYSILDPEEVRDLSVGALIPHA